MALFPHLTEKLIHAAQERGEFENLPGAGKPIPGLDEPYDEHWWVRKWMAREGLDPSRELREEGGSPGLIEALCRARDDRERRTERA
jgi:hypothetical protein